jgi:hypothetical protein
MDIAVINPVITKSSVIYQRNYNNQWSRLLNLGFESYPLNFFRFDIHYIITHICEDNEIYTIVSPMRDSAIQGFFIRQDSNIAVIRSVLKIKDIYLSCRYHNQHRKTITIYQRLEFFASAYF